MKIVLIVWFLVYAALYYVLIFYFMMNMEKIKNYIRTKINSKYEKMQDYIYLLIIVVGIILLIVLTKYTGDIYKFVQHWHYESGLPIK